MKIVMATQERYDQYVSWWAARGKPAPPPGRMFFVESDAGVLLVGACVYHADHFLFAEHIATNPAAGLKSAHAAAKLLGAAGQGYAAIEGKPLVVIARTKGLVKLWEAAGFKSEPEMKVLTWFPS